MAAQALELKQQSSGLILIASVATDEPVDTYVIDMPLHKIESPALVMSANNDLCDEWTPRSAAKVIAERLSHASQVTLLYSEGAINEDSLCDRLSAHNYSGIEDKVVLVIINFIQQHIE